jgi:hypothetical protein
MTSKDHQRNLNHSSLLLHNLASNSSDKSRSLSGDKRQFQEGMRRNIELAKNDHVFKGGKESVLSNLSTNLKNAVFRDQAISSQSQVQPLPPTSAHQSRVEESK